MTRGLALDKWTVKLNNIICPILVEIHEEVIERNTDSLKLSNNIIDILGRYLLKLKLEDPLPV